MTTITCHCLWGHFSCMNIANSATHEYSQLCSSNNERTKFVRKGNNSGCVMPSLCEMGKDNYYKPSKQATCYVHNRFRISTVNKIFLIFIRPCIINIIPNYKMQSFLIYFYRCSTYFGRFPHPSSGAHNCTYSFRYCQPIPIG